MAEATEHTVAEAMEHTVAAAALAHGSSQAARWLAQVHTHNSLGRRDCYKRARSGTRPRATGGLCTLEGACCERRVESGAFPDFISYI